MSFREFCVNLDTKLFSMIKANIYTYSFHFFWVWQTGFQSNHRLIETDLAISN